MEHSLDRIPITAAETLLNAGDRPWVPKSDLRQARALASLVCTSEPSIEAFITYGFEEAMAIIERHRALVLAMARALDRSSRAHPHPYRDRRGDLAELAHEALAAEQARRAVWRRTIENSENSPRP